MEKKYILTDETMEYRGHTLHRVKAVKDFGDVKAGDLGGWIESEWNLSHAGLCWVRGEAMVAEHARIFDDAQVYEKAQVYGEALVAKSAQVFGCSKVYEQAVIHEEAMIYGAASILGDACLRGDAKVCGTSFVEGEAKLDRNAYVQTGKDYLCIGPIGSRDDFTTFYRTKDQGIWVSCGCFIGSIEAFKKAVRKKHAGTLYKKEYLATIKLAKIKLS